MSNLLVYIILFIVLLIVNKIAVKLIDDKKTERLANNLTIIVAIVTIISYVQTIPSTPQPRDDATPPSLITIEPKHRNQFQEISLREISRLSQPETNLELLPGTNILNEIPFETGWKVSTQCEYLYNNPVSFTLPTKVPNPKYVYLLLQSAGTDKEFQGKEIGLVTLRFSNGRGATTQLLLGENIRDWALNRSPQAVSTATSPQLTEGWQNTIYIQEENRTVIGVMDILTIEIPNDYWSLQLESIEIKDTTAETIDKRDPCLHILGVTVGYD